MYESLLRQNYYYYYYYWIEWETLIFKSQIIIIIIIIIIWQTSRWNLLFNDNFTKDQQTIYSVRRFDSETKAFVRQMVD